MPLAAWAGRSQHDHARTDENARQRNEQPFLRKRDDELDVHRAPRNATMFFLRSYTAEGKPARWAMTCEPKLWVRREYK